MPSLRNSKVKPVILITGFLLLLSLCKNSSDTDRIIEIPIGSLKDYEEPVRISELSTGVRIIPLETLPGNLIGSIGDLKVTDSTIFIFSRELKSIDLYTLQGEFIRRIQSVGRGPGEYMQPAGFDVDTVIKAVYIYDWNSKKIETFSYLSGDYLGEKGKTPGSKGFHNFAVDSNHLIYISCSSPEQDDAYFIWVEDTQNSVVSKYVPYQLGENNARLVLPYSVYGNFHKSVSSTKIFWPYSTIIYHLSGEGVVPFASLVSDRVLASETDYYNLINSSLPELKTIMETPKVYGITGYSENKDNALIIFRFKTTPYYILYSFRSRDVICFTAPSLIDDYLGIKGMNILGIYGNFMVTYIPPISVNALAERLSTGSINISSIQREELDSIISYNNASGGGISNPVLVFYELRKK